MNDERQKRASRHGDPDLRAPNPLLALGIGLVILIIFIIVIFIVVSPALAYG